MKVQASYNVLTCRQPRLIDPDKFAMLDVEQARSSFIRPQSERPS